MTTELATIPIVQNETVSVSTFLLHPEIEKRSAMLARSTMIPESFRNNPSNCLIALDIALRLQTSPLMVMQNLYIVQGRPSWSGQFLIACINKSGLFKTPLRFKFSGKENTDDYGCVAYAIDKNGETLESTKITVAMAKKEKWWSPTTCTPLSLRNNLRSSAGRADSIPKSISPTCKQREQTCLYRTSGRGS